MLGLVISEPCLTRDPLCVAFLGADASPCSTLLSDRHVFADKPKKENSYENVKVSGSAWDTNLIAAGGVSACSSTLRSP